MVLSGRSVTIVCELSSRFCSKWLGGLVGLISSVDIAVPDPEAIYRQSATP